jgi:hypothetical protein
MPPENLDEGVQIRCDLNRILLSNTVVAAMEWSGTIRAQSLARVNVESLGWILSDIEWKCIDKSFIPFCLYMAVDRVRSELRSGLNSLQTGNSTANCHEFGLDSWLPCVRSY